MVDQAIGVILAAGQLTPDQGWDVLREVSQRTNTKLRHVSEQIIDWARTGQLCTETAPSWTNNSRPTASCRTAKRERPEQGRRPSGGGGVSRGDGRIDASANDQAPAVSGCMSGFVHL
ncbi:ANTAR domain-containing protein [Streptomyces sp. NPDC006465]|uniref:ANTAR domain-containing protein n=1 Tax=Streptomyces sp. NPDC006465 TaxID=3157174 RepID=UPI0033A14B38